MMVQKAVASGTTTSHTQPGQLQLKTEGDVVYLDTRVNSDINTTPTQITRNFKPLFGQISSTSNLGIVKPAGFVDDLGTYISSVLSLVMVVCLLLVLLNFIQAGLQWITSGGDKSKIDESRNRITHAFIGIIIVSASFATAGFVAYILGFGSMNDVLSSLPTINTI